MDVSIKKSSFLEMSGTVLAVIIVAVFLLVLLSIFFCCLCIPKCLLHQHKVVSCLNFQISIKASYSHHQQRCTNSFYTNFTITKIWKSSHSSFNPIPYGEGVRTDPPLVLSAAILWWMHQPIPNFLTFPINFPTFIW